MSYEETEGIEKGRLQGVEMQWEPTSASAVTDIGVLGKVMPLMRDTQNWRGGHAGDGVYKQVNAMSCLSDVVRHTCSQQD